MDSKVNALNYLKLFKAFLLLLGYPIILIHQEGEKLVVEKLL